MLKLSAADWNELYPLGTEVMFELVRGRPETRERRTTRGHAWEQSSGHVVVMLDGRSGGCSIEHMAPVRIAARPDQ